MFLEIFTFFFLKHDCFRTPRIHGGRVYGQPRRRKGEEHSSSDMAEVCYEKPRRELQSNYGCGQQENEKVNGK